MATRALPDLIARIRVDSSGVDASMANLVGSFGKANLALAGVGAGIGVLIAGGVDMIKISEKWDEAQLSLTQAVDAHNASLGKSATVIADTTKQADAYSKALDARTIALNVVEKAQMSYTAAVARHGAGSPAALTAQLNLEDATIRLKTAQDAAKDSEIALTAARAGTTSGTKATAINLEQFRSQIDSFIRTNRRYLGDQAEAVAAFAALTRAGLTQNEVQLDMSRAVDLSALKHISLTAAVDLLTKAEAGRFRGLIDLGISTGKYTDAQGNLVNGTKDVTRAMTELDAKTAHGRDTLTEAQQNSNELKQNWEDLAKTTGPKLLGAENDLIAYAVLFGDAWNKIAADDALWHGIRDRLNQVGVWVQNYILSPLGQVGEYISGAPIVFPGQGSGPAAPHSRQFGGPVLPNSIYTVGEAGPETLAMGPAGTGGRVIPNSGGAAVGGAINVYVNNPRADAWEIGAELAFLKKTRRL